MSVERPIPIPDVARTTHILSGKGLEEAPQQSLQVPSVERTAVIFAQAAQFQLAFAKPHEASSGVPLENTAVLNLTRE